MLVFVRSLVVLLSLSAATFATEKTADDDGLKLPLEPDRTVRFDTDEATWLSLDVAPDGQSLVLEILGDLYTLPIAGGEATPLTSGMAFDSQPRFSPEGGRIVFVSDRDGNENLWIIDADGGNPRKLPKGGRRVEFASPSWSPDGGHVVASRTTWGLRTFELWAYHVDGGKGVRLTKAKASKTTAAGDRKNALGAVYGPDGRYLYFAGKYGGFGYNLNFPLWQINRRDLRSGEQDTLTGAQGSGIRPEVSADGRWLVYGTRYEQQTGLRIRDLESGEDRWLAYPVQHDEQESRFTRDLLPGYAFTPDSQAVIYSHDGGIRRVEVATGAVSAIPFTAQIEQGLGPRLYFPYRLGVGPIKARMIQNAQLSPDGTRLAFSAFTRLYVYDLVKDEHTAVIPDGMQAYHPTWSPDGRELGFVSWHPEGGHVWRVRSNGRSRPKQLTDQPAYYTDPVWSPDGERIVALRATSYERLYREWDDGAPVGSDLVWIPAKGGATRLIVPSRGYSSPHFGAETDRVYVYHRNGTSGLMSLRYDGTDRRSLLVVKGPGYYNASESVAADDIRLAPDGRHALVQHANQLYVATLLNPFLPKVTVDLKTPSLPLARITDVGADYFGWNGDEIYWSVGHELYRRPLASVEFGRTDDEPEEEPDAEEESDGLDDTAVEELPAQPQDEEATETVAGETTEADETQLAEAHEAVVAKSIAIYRPRHRPEGVLALVGGTVHTMTADAEPVVDAVVIIEDDRVVAVGGRDEVMIPEGAS
ncbi:MAG: hypothetical protein OES38_10545, partial [Gammaproteobacteria bacterium]|nr:hypothetical protein [Gammaproteobacteria bacterium]